MMKPFIIYLAIGFSFISIHMEAQRNALTETKTNTVQKDFRKILILGSCALETRAFLDLLAANLIAELRHKNIKAAFFFTTNDTTQIHSEIDQHSPDSSKAILAFRALDSSELYQVRYKKNGNFFSPWFGAPNYPTYSSKIDFQAVFDIKLYTPQQVSETIWGAILEVEGDYRKNPQIDVIAQKIMSSLKANKVVR